MERAENPAFIEAIGTKEGVWVGDRQGKPKPLGEFRGVEFIVSPQGERLAILYKVGGGQKFYNLTETTLHLEQWADFQEHKIDAPYRNPDIKYLFGPATIGSINPDRRYQELDDFLLKPPSLIEAIKPAFKSILEGLSQRWNQLFDRIDKRLCRNILATQSPTAQRYNTP